MSNFLNTLDTKDIIQRQVEVPKKEQINNVPFQEFLKNSIENEGFETIKSSFYSSKFSLEQIPTQQKIDLDQENSIVYYQIPYTLRSNGVIPNTFTIEYASGDELVDDGNGNLVNENEEIIGNIFYNSGVIIVKGSGSFDSTTPYNSIKDDNSIIFYDRNTFFLKEQYFVKIPEGKFSNTSNTTFKNSESEYPFFTKIVLLNDENEPILVATINKPIPTDQSSLVVIDVTNPIY